jgi:hypothetical protein
LLRWKNVEIFFIVFVLLCVVVREVLVGFETPQRLGETEVTILTRQYRGNTEILKL